MCCGGAPLRNLAPKAITNVYLIRMARSLRHQVTISGRNAASPRKRDLPDPRAPRRGARRSGGLVGHRKGGLRVELS